jgi:hypothetical protein
MRPGGHHSFCFTPPQPAPIRIVHTQLGCPMTPSRSVWHRKGGDRTVAEFAGEGTPI